jgi:hypothetical protein
MSGMEALAAIGLASNVAQFIEMALKIYKSAHSNASGLSDDFSSIEDLANTLRAHSTAVAKGVEGKLAPEDEQIVQIASQCRAIAEDLLRVVQRFKVPDDRFRSLSLVGKAVGAAWNRSKIKEMEALLEKYNRQLVTHIVSSCR